MTRILNDVMRDDSLRARLGFAARDDALQRFDLDRMLKATSAIYRQVL